MGKLHTVCAASVADAHLDARWRYLLINIQIPCFPHTFNDITPGGLVGRVPAVVGQHLHARGVLPEPPVLDEPLDVVDVVDAALELAPLAKVVDPDQEGLLVALQGANSM